MGTDAEVRRALKRLLKVAETLLPLADESSPLHKAVAAAKAALQQRSHQITK